MLARNSLFARLAASAASFGDEFQLGELLVGDVARHAAIARELAVDVEARRTADADVARALGCCPFEQQVAKLLMRIEHRLVRLPVAAGDLRVRQLPAPPAGVEALTSSRRAFRLPRCHSIVAFFAPYSLAA